MKKVIAVILLCSLVLSGCAAQETERPETPGAVRFTDDLGREVVVQNPQRVACLTASFADIWCLAGGAESVVAATDATWKYFDLPLGEDVVRLGAAKTLNLEQLLACEPDLVLASCGPDRNVELEQTFAEMGLNVAYFDVDSFDDYLRMLDVCTRLTGQTENYARYGTSVRERVEAAVARADGSQPTVLYIRVTGSGYKVKNSEGSVLGEMLAAMDCRNIADIGDTGLEQLSMEHILAADPQHIFLVLQGSDPTDAQQILETTLLNDPAWQSLTAVREGRVHLMDQNLYNMKPDARWGEAYELLADILYPAR